MPEAEKLFKMAGMRTGALNKSIGWFGRVMFAMLFLVSGLNKFATTHPKKGGSIVDYMTPKLDLAMNKVGKYTGFDVAQYVDDEMYVRLIFVSATMEVLGGVLFICDRPFGAYVLIGYIAVVTAICHNFYDFHPSQPEFESELIHVMKNIAMIGALVQYLALIKPEPQWGKRYTLQKAMDQLGEDAEAEDAKKKK